MAGRPPADGRDRPEFTETCLVYAHKAAHVAVWLGGGALILVSLLVTIEVILREVFLIGLSAATENQEALQGRGFEGRPLRGRELESNDRFGNVYRRG